RFQTEADLTEIRQNRGMWLRKINHHLESTWGPSPGGGQAGSCRIPVNSNFPQVHNTLQEKLARISNIGSNPSPLSENSEHPVIIQSLSGQALNLFQIISSESLSLCGLTIRRCRCRPAAKQNLRRLERGSIASDNDPGETQQQLSKVITSELSRISNHNLNIEYHRHVSDDGSRARTFKRFIITLLYSVKSRHRSISLKKIVKIWKQPKVSYL
uniref:Uncharacterized protein n=1 Tax=Sus scrofa TaxID=9823 RepID=A0A8D1CEH9_PIG